MLFRLLANMTEQIRLSNLNSHVIPEWRDSNYALLDRYFSQDNIKPLREEKIEGCGRLSLEGQAEALMKKYKGNIALLSKLEPVGEYKRSVSCTVHVYDHWLGDKQTELQSLDDCIDDLK